MTARDSRGRFIKKPQEEFNWEVVIIVALFVIAVSGWCYLIPTWVSGVQKESYDKGYAAGDADGFNIGFKKGDEYHGWNASLYSRSLLCNTTICRSLDNRYNTRYEFPMYRTTINWMW